MAWEIIDYNVLRRTSDPCPNQGGQVSITLAAVPVGQVWLVSGIAVRCPTVPPVPCILYDLDISGIQFFVGGVDPLPPVGPVPCGGTYAGKFDTNDESGLIITGGNSLSLVWVGVDLGVQASARVQYAVAQRAGSPAAQPILGVAT